jgi:hypothetical protein
VGHQLQVRQFVVRAIAVAVMNMLFGAENSPKVPFHHKPMLVDVRTLWVRARVIRTVNPHIPGMIDRATTGPIGMHRPATSQHFNAMLPHRPTDCHLARAQALRDLLLGQSQRCQ